MLERKGKWFNLLLKGASGLLILSTLTGCGLAVAPAAKSDFSWTAPNGINLSFYDEVHSGVEWDQKVADKTLNALCSQKSPFQGINLPVYIKNAQGDIVAEQNKKFIANLIFHAGIPSRMNIYQDRIEQIFANNKKAIQLDSRGKIINENLYCYLLKPEQKRVCFTERSVESILNHFFVHELIHLCWDTDIEEKVNAATARHFTLDFDELTTDTHVLKLPR